MAKADRKAPKTREQQITAICKAINSGDFGGENKDAVMWLGSRDRIVLPRFSSGCMDLDDAMGGGYPEGRFIEVFGPESSSKTTILLHAIAEYQKAHPERDVAMIDTEFAFDEEYAENIGVNTKWLIVSQPDDGEQALNVAQQMMQLGVGFIGVDSVAALTTRAEIEGAMGDVHVAEQARLMSQSLRKLAAEVKRRRATMLWTNQMRDKIGASWGEQTTQPGGRALRHWASIRISMARISSVKEGPKENRVVVCTKHRAEVKKNKCAAPFRKADFYITFGHGIDVVAAILDAAISKGVVDKRGSWFSFKGEQLGQGRVQVLEILRTDKEYCRKIEDATHLEHPPAPEPEEGPDGVERVPVTRGAIDVEATVVNDV